MKAIINGKILTMDKEDFEIASILINEEGKIQAVGQVEIPENYEIIDAKGKYVLPGFIDAHTHLGIYEEIYSHEGDDVNEMSEPITPQLRAVDGINIHDIAFNDALKGGVTSVMIAPGSANVVGGTVCIMKTAGKSFNKRLVKSTAGMKVAFGENPKDVYGSEKKMPYTRMGIAALLRETLVDGQNYSKDKEAARDLGKDEINKVLKNKMPLRAHAHRADDILTALRIAEEFNLKLIIEHGTEAHLTIEELKERNVPVCIGPLLMSRAKVELKEKSFKNPGLLQRQGIKIALITDHPETPIDYAVVNAILSVKEGMDPKEALKALTINPAEIMGIEDRTGSISTGKDGDIVIWSGNPLDIMSKVELVMIEGNVVYQGE